jgi:hypothetical protein
MIEMRRYSLKYQVLEAMYCTETAVPKSKLHVLGNPALYKSIEQQLRAREKN